MSEGTVRLFVALELPGDVIDALVAWRTPLLEREQDLRPVPVESIHITLVFLGSLPASTVDPLAEAVARRAVPVPGLTLGAPLWLPRRRPRVLTVAVEDREGALRRLQAQVAQALAAGGWYESEDRPYLPHVTLARVRGREADATRLAKQPLPAPPPLEFAGAALTLYRSHLGRGPARYERLATVPL